MLIAVLMNSLSKNGTRASRPHAEVALLALRQSYWWRALICKGIALIFSQKRALVGVLPRGAGEWWGGREREKIHLAACFAVEFLLVGGLVKVEVSAKDLVGAFAGDYHLDPQGLDLPGHEEHGRAGPDCRHVVGLDVVDDVLDRVDPILYREVELVVNRAEVLRHLLPRFQVRRALQIYQRRAQIARIEYRVGRKRKKDLEVTSSPTQKEWSCVPHCLAALDPARWRAVTEATSEESSPPLRRTPKGTSVISLLITA